jgi:hypothetical protein
MRRLFTPVVYAEEEVISRSSPLECRWPLTLAGGNAYDPGSESALSRTVGAIAITKQVHDGLIQPPTGSRQRWRMVNCQRDYMMLRQRFRTWQRPVGIGLEATGTYHRPVAYVLHQCGFELRLISSQAVVRPRDVLYNSWDKNDPKDAQVLLHVLKTGVSPRDHDPLVHARNDLQKLAQTHSQVSLRTVRVQHRSMPHSRPLYFPEAERDYTNSRAEWVHSAPAPLSRSRRKYPL